MFKVLVEKFLKILNQILNPMTDEERYLAQSVDLSDYEHRVKQLERNGLPYKNRIRIY